MTALTVATLLILFLTLLMFCVEQYKAMRESVRLRCRAERLAERERRYDALNSEGEDE
jgi:hypothetical protein